MKRYTSLFESNIEKERWFYKNPDKSKTEISLIIDKDKKIVTTYTTISKRNRETKSTHVSKAIKKEFPLSDYYDFLVDLKKQDAWERDHVGDYVGKRLKMYKGVK